MTSLTDDFNLAANDNQADGFKAELPRISAPDDQADGYKGPPEGESITVMKPLTLNRGKK
jgi:hypothetical protein